jgi:hypothetical protein
MTTNNHGPREDLSPYLIHFTKEFNGNTAFENLISILREKKIRGTGPQNMYSARMRKEQIDASIQDKFRVACFSEVPLELSHHLVNNPLHGHRKFSEYGLVFKKDTIKKHQGNPVLYVNDENKDLKKFLNGEYEHFILNEQNTDSYRYLGAISNIVKPRVDYQFEREWRVVGDFSFNLDDIEYIIAPKGKHEDIQNYYLAPYVPCLDVHEYQNLKFLMDEPCTLNIVVRTAKTFHHDYYVDHHFSIHARFSNRYLVDAVLASLSNFGVLSWVYDELDNQYAISINEHLFSLFESAHDPDDLDDGDILYNLEEQLHFMKSLYSEEVLYIFEREPDEEERMRNANYTMTLKGPFDQYAPPILHEIINAIISTNGGQMKVVNWSGVDI